jgi:hypothetical protein
MLSKKAISAIAVLCLPACGLAAWHFWPQREPEYKAYLRHAGYLPLAQPSRLFPPGSIGTLETLRNGSLALHPTCPIDRKQLEPLMMTSHTVDNTLSGKMANSIAASAEAVAAAMSKARGVKTRTFTLSMKNMQIVSMADSDLMKVRSSYLKDNCEAAIVVNLRAGSRVCQTSEALQADLDYDLAFTEELSAEQRAQLSKALSEASDISLNTETKDQTQGKELYFGIKIALRCFRLDDKKQKVADAI